MAEQTLFSTEISRDLFQLATSKIKLRICFSQIFIGLSKAVGEMEITRLAPTHTVQPFKEVEGG